MYGELYLIWFKNKIIEDNTMAKMMLRPALLNIRRQSVKWIIVHHTDEYYTRPETKIDNPKYQMGSIFNGVLEKKDGDVNYHYVIEKIKEDYVAIVTRPTVYLCEWDDIPININKRAVHVAMLGSYDLKLPEKRLYDVLAYRILNPMLKIYGLSPAKIKLHREVSEEEITCPGEFFAKERMITSVRKFVIK